MRAAASLPPRIRRALVSFCGSILLLGPGSPASAQVADGCAYDPATLTVSITVVDPALINYDKRNHAENKLIVGSSGAIEFDRTPCAEATVTNTDTIVVTGEPITDLYIDLAGGPFAPGATAEADGSSEIEIEVDFVNDQPSYSSLFIWGTGSRDSFVAGEEGIDITGDLDADVFLSGRGPALTLIGSGGGDTLSARGGGGLGGPIGHVGFQGGSGPDRLLGGLAFEYLDGGNGNDRLAAGPGEDMAFGERGNDVIKGQGGDENRLLGGAGDDRVIGGPGVDICREGRGNRPTRCEVRFRDAFLD